MTRCAVSLSTKRYFRETRGHTPRPCALLNSASLCVRYTGHCIIKCSTVSLTLHISHFPVSCNPCFFMCQFSLQWPLSTRKRIVVCPFVQSSKLSYFHDADDDDITCGAYDSNGLLPHAKAISSIPLNRLRAIYHLG